MAPFLWIIPNPLINTLVAQVHSIADWLQIYSTVFLCMTSRHSICCLCYVYLCSWRSYHQMYLFWDYGMGLRQKEMLWVPCWLELETKKSWSTTTVITWGKQDTIHLVTMRVTSYACYFDGQLGAGIELFKENFWPREIWFLIWNFILQEN